MGPGKGFRNLRPGERIPEGGEFYGWRNGGREWVLSLEVGGIPSDCNNYRVRVLPPPKAPRKAPKLPETSLEAKESQKDKAPVDREIIMGHMKKHPRGTTCDRLEAVLGMSHQTASARINDLARAGRVVDSGRREKTRTGRNAICWKVVGK